VPCKTKIFSQSPSSPRTTTFLYHNLKSNPDGCRAVEKRDSQEQLYTIHKITELLSVDEAFVMKLLKNENLR
jgi:hypothetical protein